MSRSERLAQAVILRFKAESLMKEAEALEIRETGRTTAKALNYINTLYSNPGISYLISDHPVSPNASQSQADIGLLNTILHLTREMGLQGFTSIGYNLVYNKPDFLKGK